MLDIHHIETFFPEYLRSFGKHMLREYLQYKILEIIFDSPYRTMLTFKGGTAIHIVHGNTRFSEGLDFDRAEMSFDDFKALIDLIQKKLHLEGYDVETKLRSKTSLGASLKVPKILYDNGISPLPAEKLMIKIDTALNNFSYTPHHIILNKFDVFIRINVVPLDLLLAQKINAFFSRKRTVGRDIYDIVFLLGSTMPNYDYLNEKLRISSLNSLKEKLIEKAKKCDLPILAHDVEPFLFRSQDAKKIHYFLDYVASLVQ